VQKYSVSRRDGEIAKEATSAEIVASSVDMEQNRRAEGRKKAETGTKDKIGASVRA
jgi:hypothetical protein